MPHRKTIFSGMTKRMICLLLCLALAAAFPSCAKHGEEEPTTAETSSEPAIPEGSVSVPYQPEDSLNPFFMNNVVNAALVSLYCRGLYYLDSGFQPVNDLAQSQVVSVENVKVKLKSDLVFSDGSRVTAEDVVYSFKLAEDSVLYAEHLDGVESCAAADENTVLFSLETPDVNVLNGLVFPVVKSGTAGKTEDLPVSCGHYRLNQDGVRTSLVCNMRYDGALPSVGTVRLTEVTDNTVLESLVDAGEINFCYSDLSHGSAKRTYASVTDVYLNNLVFIGVNSNNYNFGYADMRRALSLALDRQEIVSAGFQSFARAAVLPFNTSWTVVSESPAAAELYFTADLAAAEALLAPYGAGTGGSACEVSLLCPESNSFLRNTANVIARQLAQVNVTVTVETVDRYSYNAALTSGDFDLYLGEIKLAPTMRLDAFFHNGAASYGIDAESGGYDDDYYDYDYDDYDYDYDDYDYDYDYDDDDYGYGYRRSYTSTGIAGTYERYRGGEITFDEFVTAFAAEMPFIPLCFRNGRMCYTTNVSSVSGVTEYRLFGDIDRWTIEDVPMSG